METLELPFIRFGRNRNGIMDFYTVQEQSPSIPQEVADIFRGEIAKSIQWESTAEIPKYADCFLIRRTDDSGFLFARLADGGNDSFKRNHSMQIDAVYLTNEQLPATPHGKATFFASLCFFPVWEYWEEHKKLQPLDENEQKVVQLAEKILTFCSENRFSDQSLFLAAHPHFTPCGIDQIVRGYENLPEIQPVPMKKKTDNHTDNHSAPLPNQPSTPAFFPVEYVTYTLLVLLAFGVAGMGFLAWYWYDETQKLQADYQLLQIENENTKSELETIRKEYQDAKRTAEKQLQEIQEKNSEIATNNRQIKKLETDKNNLTLQLQTARSNADKSLKTENESLKNQNEILNKKMTIIQQHIEIIFKELSHNKE